MRTNSTPEALWEGSGIHQTSNKWLWVLEHPPARTPATVGLTVPDGSSGNQEVIYNDISSRLRKWGGISDLFINSILPAPHLAQTVMFCSPFAPRD